ncbi:MAG: orotidine-5'-phosphate decarboxylase [Firmicutes bacterium]|nr:orotidine-5'-phosphate decarboxylase [Bacillota bacterium]
MDETPFPARVLAAVAAKRGPVVVGLDPRPERLPRDLIEWGRQRHPDTRRATAAAVGAFDRLIIDAVHDVAVAVKPQLAFYEQLGWPGIQILEETMSYARRKGLLVIADGKRNDIGSTAVAYARAYLGVGGEESGLVADALTVNPYLGTDSIEPFLPACRRGKGVFVLVRTSNPSGAELQDYPADSPGAETVAQRVARMVLRLNEGLPAAGGFGPVGAVVGATTPEHAARLRRELPGVLFLVPGYGAQGAGAAEAANAFVKGGGALVNSSRDILYAWEREHPGEPGTADDFAQAARGAALRMRDALAAAAACGRNARLDSESTLKFAASKE